MEFSIFRIAIYALALSLMLYLVLSFFSMPKEDYAETLSNNLKMAEANEGMLIKSKINFGVNSIISSASIENQGRSIKISCMSPELCTPDIVVYDERSAVFKKKIAMDVYARCEYEINLYKCSLYFGKKPAQLEISSFALADMNDSIYAEITNSGDFDAENITANAELYKIYTASGKNKEVFYKEAGLENIERLSPEGKASLHFYFGNLEKATYIVKVKVWANEAGFARKEATFTSDGKIEDGCRAESQGETLIMDGKCIEKYFCSGCSLAYKCRDAWAEKMPEKEGFLIKTKDYTTIEYQASEGNCR